MVPVPRRGPLLHEEVVILTPRKNSFRLPGARHLAQRATLVGFGEADFDH
jgi:hypothetical protein